MIKKIIFCLSLLSLFTAAVPATSFGQTNTIGSALEMTMVPENPEPGQSVKITLKSFSFDIDRATITWFINGQEKITGVGIKEYSTVAGKNGEKTTVKASILPLDKSRTEIEAFFIASSVDLIYESLSYTPPFYKGRAMNPNQGAVVVVAMPNLVNNAGQKISTENIVYSWKKDGKVQASVSGIGKNTFTFSGTVPIRDTTIGITVSTIDNTIFSTKEITISNYPPQIIFYENSPVYGIMMNKAVKNTVKMLTDEFSVLATPYFFSSGYATTPDLDYVWSLNNKTVGNQEIKNAFTVRQEKAGAGTANIDLKINNNVRIFQFTTNGYTINFEKQ